MERKLQLFFILQLLIVIIHLIIINQSSNLIIWLYCNWSPWLLFKPTGVKLLCFPRSTVAQTGRDGGSCLECVWSVTLHYAALPAFLMKNKSEADNKFRSMSKKKSIIKYKLQPPVYAAYPVFVMMKKHIWRRSRWTTCKAEIRHYAV